HVLPSCRAVGGSGWHPPAGLAFQHAAPPWGEERGQPRVGKQRHAALLIGEPVGDIQGRDHSHPALSHAGHVQIRHVVERGVRERVHAATDHGQGTGRRRDVCHDGETVTVRLLHQGDDGLLAEGGDAQGGAHSVVVDDLQVRGPFGDAVRDELRGVLRSAHVRDRGIGHRRMPARGGGADAGGAQACPHRAGTGLGGADGCTFGVDHLGFAELVDEGGHPEGRCQGAGAGQEVHVRVDQSGQQPSAVLDEQVPALLHLGATDRGDPAIGDAQMGGGQSVAVVDEAGGLDGDRCCVHAGNAKGSRSVKVQRRVTGWIIRSGMWPGWLVSPRAPCVITTTSVCWCRAMWPPMATAGTGRGGMLRSGMWPGGRVSPRAPCVITPTSVCWCRAMWPPMATAGTGAGNCCGCNASSCFADCAFRWARCSRCSMARPMSAQRWLGTARNCWQNERNWTGSWRPWTAPWRLWPVNARYGTRSSSTACARRNTNCRSGWPLAMGRPPGNNSLPRKPRWPDGTAPTTTGRPNRGENCWGKCPWRGRAGCGPRIPRRWTWWRSITGRCVRCGPRMHAATGGW